MSKHALGGCGAQTSIGAAPRSVTCPASRHIHVALDRASMNQDPSLCQTVLSAPTQASSHLTFTRAAHVGIAPGPETCSVTPSETGQGPGPGQPDSPWQPPAWLCTLSPGEGLVCKVVVGVARSVCFSQPCFCRAVSTWLTVCPRICPPGK